MNKLVSNPIFMNIFIMYFYSKDSFQLKRDKWNI